MKKTEINDIEQFFEWWLLEMLSAGYIKEFFREPETMVVRTTAEYGRYKRFKSKEKEVEIFNLFPEIKYTYDYQIIWNKEAEYLFYEETNEAMVFQFGKPKFIAHYNQELEHCVSYVDVKPTNSVQQKGGKVSSSITFPLKCRMLWDSQRLFINKVVPIPMRGTGHSMALFITTFTPQRYLLTNGGGQARKIKFKVKSLKEYALEKTKIINNILKTTK